MSKPARRGLSIFDRTFVLLAVALLTAQAVGIALLVMRTPIYEPPVHPPEVVALLSTRMPAGTQILVESVVDNATDIGAELLPGPAITLDGDPLALRRAAMNLLENALKYRKRARLQLQRDGEDGVLWIDDDGSGIDSTQCEQVTWRAVIRCTQTARPARHAHVRPAARSIGR